MRTPPGRASVSRDKTRGTERPPGAYVNRRPSFIPLDIHHPGIPPQGVLPVVGLSTEHVGHGPWPKDAGETASEEQFSEFFPLPFRAQQAHGLQMALVPPQGRQNLGPGQGLHHRATEQVGQL